MSQPGSVSVVTTKNRKSKRLDIGRPIRTMYSMNGTRAKHHNINRLTGQKGTPGCYFGQISLAGQVSYPRTSIRCNPRDVPGLGVPHHRYAPSSFRSYSNDFPQTGPGSYLSGRSAQWLAPSMSSRAPRKQRSGFEPLRSC